MFLKFGRWRPVQGSATRLKTGPARRRAVFRTTAKVFGHTVCKSRKKCILLYLSSKSVAGVSRHTWGVKTYLDTEYKSKFYFPPSNGKTNLHRFRTFEG